MAIRATSSSEWISCPECGSQDVRIKKETDADKAICKECGNKRWLV